MIRTTEANLKAATEILEFITQADGYRRPHNPCVTFDKADGLLRFTSNLHPMSASEVMLINDLACDSVGDGWELGLESELIQWINETSDFEPNVE